MLHEAQAAMQATLAFGPGHCPPDLFAGTVPAIVRGLKAHANTISHARFIALEESYPKLRDEIGAAAFHRAAERHLDDPNVRLRTLDQLGEGFERQLIRATWRNLARTEWAWLEAYHAPDAAAFSIEALALLAPEELVAVSVDRHPAARLIMLEEGQGAMIVTRPEADVQVTPLNPDSADLFASIDCAVPLGTLLATSPAPTILALIAAGAVIAQGDLP